MKWTLACIAVLACIGLASAFKCYTCDNAGNCADDMVKKATPSLLMACDTGVTPAAGVTLPPFVACKKEVSTNGQVDRGCATLAQCPDGKDSCNADGTVCCCSTSECNSATTQRVSYAVVASTLVVTLVAKLF